MDYSSFIREKSVRAASVGFDAGDLNPNLFNWQAAIVRWALRKGRAALFEDCGLGKTIQQLAWAELKPSYFKAACENLSVASGQGRLFS